MEEDNPPGGEGSSTNGDGLGELKEKRGDSTNTRSSTNGDGLGELKEKRGDSTNTCDVRRQRSGSGASNLDCDYGEASSSSSAGKKKGSVSERVNNETLRDKDPKGMPGANEGDDYVLQVKTDIPNQQCLSLNQGRSSSAPAHMFNPNRHRDHSSPHPFRGFLGNLPNRDSALLKKSSSAEDKMRKNPVTRARGEQPRSRSIDYGGEVKASSKGKPPTKRSRSWIGFSLSRKSSSSDVQGSASSLNSIKEEIKLLQDIAKIDRSGLLYENEEHTRSPSQDNAEQYQKFVQSLTNTKSSKPILKRSKSEVTATNVGRLLETFAAQEVISNMSVKDSSVAIKRGGAHIQHFIDEVGQDGFMESDEWYHCSTVKGLDVFKKRYAEEIDCIRERKVIEGSFVDISNYLTDMGELRKKWDPYFLEGHVIERLAHNVRIVYLKYETPFLFRPRDFVVMESDYVDRKTHTHLRIINSVLHSDYPPKAECMRGEFLISGFMIKREDAGTPEFTTPRESGSYISDRNSDLWCITLLWQTDYKYYIHHKFDNNTFRRDKKFLVNEHDSKLLSLERAVTTSLHKEDYPPPRERSESDAMATRLRLLLSLLPLEEGDEELPERGVEISQSVNLSKDAAKSSLTDEIHGASRGRKESGRFMFAFGKKNSKKSLKVRKLSLQQGANLTDVEEEGKKVMSSLTEEHRKSLEEKRYPFYTMLKDSCCRVYFGRFLETEFNAENLEFWTAVETFKKHSLEDSVEEITFYMSDIVRRFITNGAPQQVNLADADRAAIENELQNWVEKVQNNDTSDPPFTVFNNAQLIIANLMKNDPYNRFVESDLYREMLEYLSENGANVHVRMIDNFLRIMRESSSLMTKLTNPWKEFSSPNDPVRVFLKLHMDPYFCVRETTSFKAPMNNVLKLFLDLSETRRKWDPFFVKGKIVEEIDNNMCILWIKLPRPLRLHSFRDICALRIARQDISGGFFVVQRSIEQRVCPKTSAKRVNMLTSGYYIRRDENDLETCHVTYLLQIDMKMKTAFEFKMFRKKFLKHSFLASVKRYIERHGVPDVA
eukprot:Nk52_evm2s2085 gene=Nk52_evmTU2s2085